MLKKTLWLFLFWAPLVGAIMVGVRLYYNIYSWQYAGEEKIFKISPGEGFSSINYRLGKEGLISSTKTFHRYAQFKEIMTKFKSGHFKIPSKTNMDSLINILILGAPVTARVTIPEGKNIFEIGKILEAQGIVSYEQFIRYAKDANFAEHLGVSAERIEGYLYPDTYQFSPESTPPQVIQAMVRRFNEKTANLDFSVTSLSKHQVVTLASIVEKETGASSERPVIAGVFWNRLIKKMRLQSDPTTIYGIYENFNGNLRKADLLASTPYNTYTTSDLPIGPICNPGVEAISAVLSPARHNYLFFVSQNDGHHVFTERYKDHLAAVNKFQKERANRVGKSWRDLHKSSDGSAEK
ncbi:MAG: hypothetical protein A2504_06360 [Bdellovibrionales bacterium RIFOXYD12_FULL_39_22]|nr:MAG: hypothetical protein A2385_08680 [Bdellovibrionales bacterium RIFOXYB1_FULL_39_21]OFZ45220.1 MAG: hypothetical protein A2485_05850 [Bdellovibrionales bacterium RIFOXYC12_FULL_39_17]OFZ45587.1 MAG: hypothetical protein A2404_03260 [Bdellovibrionales bacterium RIFOXYC1_FULL_39_130]OFZ73946.1 MAG: hypothetical protein A2451_16415 [Bdellovibrionales bacterium RIFOXYC2_FULL_39_8]OFZ77449.1 MAG: hypothetical protein A2560_08850 [Bdellovibrionales bacterium RIFOXYD1_FULL_39_84]OFZ91578.1 MAG: